MTLPSPPPPDEDKLEALIALGWTYSELTAAELAEEEKKPGPLKRFKCQLSNGKGFTTSSPRAGGIIYSCYEMEFPSESDEEEHW